LIPLRWLLAVIGLFAVAPLAALADDAALMKIGLAKVDITPDGPIRLAGYHSRTSETVEIAQRLFAKAMAIEAPDGSLRVVITADLFGISDEISDEVARHLKERAGLERAQLAVTVTHSHTAPWLTGVAPYMFNGPIPEEHQQRVDQYTRDVVDKLVAVSLAAIEDRREAHLGWGQDRVDLAVNRRVIVDGKWAGWGSLPDVHVDHDLPVLVVKEPGGKLRAVMVNYACHCVTHHPADNQVHGDWAGEAAAIMEKTHDGVVAMVAIGCGADANPAIREPEKVGAHGKAIADGVERVLAAGLKPLRHAPEVELRRINLPLAPTSREALVRTVENDPAHYSASQFVKQLDRGEPLPSSVSYPIQLWQFGNDLAMVFLAGEVVSDYSLRLKGEVDASRMWVNAYANAVPSYIPSRRILDEGGYEVDDSMRYYHWPNRFEPVVEDLIMETLRDMLSESFDRRWLDQEPAELKGDNQPRMITPADDGSIRLLAEAGTPHGPRIEYMPEPEWRAFGWWTDQDYVSWEFETAGPGEFEVIKTWSVADQYADRMFVIEAGGQRVRGYAQRTGTWENFETRGVGRVTLAAGKQRLTVKPAQAFSDGGLMDLREIRLVPATPQKVAD